MDAKVNIFVFSLLTIVGARVNTHCDSDIECFNAIVTQLIVIRDHILTIKYPSQNEIENRFLRAWVNIPDVHKNPVLRDYLDTAKIGGYPQFANSIYDFHDLQSKYFNWSATAIAPIPN